MRCKSAQSTLRCAGWSKEICSVVSYLQDVLQISLANPVEKTKTNDGKELLQTLSSQAAQKQDSRSASGYGAGVDPSGSICGDRYECKHK